MARSLPQPSLLLGEGLGGGEMAAHDTGIVSHSAAVPPTDVAMGALNIISHFLFQERRFVGYSSVVRGRVGAGFPLSHWERAGVREAHTVGSYSATLALTLSRTKGESGAAQPSLAMYAQ